MKTQVIIVFDIGVVLNHTWSNTFFTPMSGRQKAAPFWTRPPDAEIHREWLDLKSWFLLCPQLSYESLIWSPFLIKALNADELNDVATCLWARSERWGLQMKSSRSTQEHNVKAHDKVPCWMKASRSKYTQPGSPEAPQHINSDPKIIQRLNSFKFSPLTHIFQGNIIHIPQFVLFLLYWNKGKKYE